MAERASWSLGAALRGVFGAKTIDEDTWDDLESALIRADFGPAVTEEIVDGSRRRSSATARPIRATCSGCSASRRGAARRSTTRPSSSPSGPAVVLVVGVNGVGKTTTIGKFARFLRTYDRPASCGAADTFRAAAVDQLATWAERAGARIVRPRARGPGPGIRRVPDRRVGEAATAPRS